MVLLVSGFVRNEATLEADIAAAMAAGGRVAPPMASYGRTLARLTDPERFPALHAVIAAGVLDAPEGEVGEDDLDGEFSFGLERVLDGIETLIENRRTGHG